jgi:hypothetical protein
MAQGSQIRIMLVGEMEERESSAPLQIFRQGDAPLGASIRIASEAPATIVFDAPAWSESIAGVDLFDCLLQLRAILESRGYLICCQGARRNVGPSGLTRQMSNGRLAYALSSGRVVSDEDLVDIFAPAPCDQVTTVADQKQYVMELLRTQWGKRAPLD